MNDSVPVLKDEHEQRPVPSVWRSTFANIVEALKEEDYRLEREIAGVAPISAEAATQIAGNINSYGKHLINLPNEAWETSVCQWMQGYWDVLVDLFTIEEGASDLVLAVRVYEDGSSYAFKVQSVHVP